MTGIMQAIHSAATKTGVDFSYLMQKASTESSFDPTAKASTSSATGLFQFTSHTWLHMIKTYGDQYGLGNYAAHIQDDGNGHLSVDSAAMKKEILALRKDPQVSAEMAGELDKENAEILQKKVGGKIGSTELYLAHFLGASGASHFIKQMRANPQMAAADVLPSAADANPSVFYDKAGDAKSLQQIYRHFAQKFDDSGVQVASLTKHQAIAAPSRVYSDIATSNQIAVNTVNMMPTANAATAQSAATDREAGGLRLAHEQLASLDTTNNTMFNAMLIGQMQNNGLTTTSLGHITDNKKKVAAYAMLS